LFVNHLVLAKSEETSMYYTICKETGIQSLTRSLYVKSNNCVELYESMERIKAHFFVMSEHYLTIKSLPCEKSE